MNARRRGIKRLRKDHPEIIPASFLLQDWDHPSDPEDDLIIDNIRPPRDSKKATTDIEPAASSLLAIGNIKLTEKPNAPADKQYRQVIGFPCGPNGEILALKLIIKERLRWREGKNESLVLRAQTALKGSTGYWTGFGGPIRQIVFGEGSKGAKNWLAVRQDALVNIFRPRSCRNTVIPSAVGLSQFGLPSSHIDAHLVYTARYQQIGEVPFSDVSFNPWNVEQIALVNQAGFWTIWHLRLQSTSSGHLSAQQIASGTTCNQDDDSSEIDDSRHIEWNKLAWVGDAFTIVVVNRSSMRIFDINREDEPRLLNAPDLELELCKDSIIDLQRDRLDGARFFVLTTSRLLWLQIQDNLDLVDSESQANERSINSNAVVLLSWVHFRNPDDTSLTISQLCDDTYNGPDREEDSKCSDEIFSSTGLRNCSCSDPTAFSAE